MSNKSTPDYMQPQLEDLNDKYELVSTLNGGTAAMRDAGTTYLPREPEETGENYNRRLCRSVLFPAYTNAVTQNTAKLFRGGFEIQGSTPLFDPLVEDIDEEANPIRKFAEEATASAIDYGISYILIDYPVVTPNATLQDEVNMGVQPYWVLLEAPQVLEASPIKVMGKNKLGVFRFKEIHAYRDGDFALSYQERVKEFRLTEEGVQYSVYFKQDSQWVMMDQGMLLGQTQIPVVPMYMNKVGYFLGSPLFHELAMENVLNWQIQSDYQNIVHMSSVPMLAITGAPQTFDDSGVREEIVISPNTVLNFTNPDSKAEWVEVNGTASEVGRAAVQESYTRMSELALEALTESVVDQTATAAVLDSEESVAVLNTLQGNIVTAINGAIDLTYGYLNVENSGTVAVMNTQTVEETIEEIAPETDTEETE